MPSASGAEPRCAGPRWGYWEGRPGALARWLSASAIVAASLLVYADSLRNGFTWDDHAMVVENAFLADPGNARHLADPRFYAQGHAVQAGTRPVFLASLFFDRALWGVSAPGHHLTSVFLHAANGVWVYAAGAVLVPGAAPALAGLLFALHPIATEAVDAVSFRSDLLAAFFVLMGLWLYVRARAAGRAAPALVLASAGCYGLGLLSKEMAATLPLLALLVERTFPEPRGRRARMFLALPAYSAVALAFLAFWAPRFSHGRSLGPLQSVFGRPAPGTLPIEAPRPSRSFAPSPPAWAALYEDRGLWLRTTARTVAAYARWLLWPRELVADRAPALVLRWSDGAFLASAVLLAGLLAGTAALLFRRSPAAFGPAWCLATLLPVCGLLPLYNPVAERYLYLVSIGFAWGLAALFAKGLEAERLRPIALFGLVALLAAYGARTFTRNRDWRDDASLFLSAPSEELSPRALYTRALLLRKRGEAAAADRELEEAVRRHPGFAEAWAALGAARGQAGRDAEATLALERALELAPANPVMRFALAEHLARTGKPERATALYRAAVEADPRFLEAWVNLAALHRDRGEDAEARRCYERAIALAGPDPVPYYSYALHLERSGRRERSIEFFRQAFARGGYAPARAALERLGARP